MNPSIGYNIYIYILQADSCLIQLSFYNLSCETKMITMDFPESRMDDRYNDVANWKVHLKSGTWNWNCEESTQSSSKFLLSEAAAGISSKKNYKVQNAQLIP